jgi:hypothetical protein
MRNSKRPVAALLLIFLLTFAPTAAAQKRTQRPKPPAPKPAGAPAISFDNLLSADSYKIYVEIRNVGQFVNSGSFSELLEPVLKLAAPPKEFRTAVRWLKAHADSVTTSRMMVAAWPTAKDIPNVLVAIEFDTTEEAAKFEPQLNEVLQKVLPPQPVSTPTPERSPTPNPQPTPNAGSQSQPPAKVELEPEYHIKRSGALVFITSSPLTIRNLKPANTRALNEDPNFRTAYDRFTSESVFAFINIKGIEQEEKEQREKAIEAHKALGPAQTTEPVPDSSPATPEEPESQPEPVPLTRTVVSGVDASGQPIGVPQPAPPPEELTNLLNSFSAAFFGGFGQAKWPEAIGLAGNLDAGSLDVRALFVASQGEKVSAVPLFPLLVSGPSLVPESPSILPADTELFVTMSLDLPKVYADFLKPSPMMVRASVGNVPAEHVEPESPFAFIEKKLDAKLSDVLLPLLGNEVVFSMPLVPESNKPATSTTVIASPSPPTDSTIVGVTGSVSVPTPTIAISLRDKEAMRVFLPKLIDAIGFKGASALAQTQKREDTEIVSYGNILSYAFIGNFLVIAPDPKNIVHVVDSYLKHETLSSDLNFKNFTRWQPRQLQGQVYVSPALMESYKTWAAEPSALMSDQTREFLSQVAVVSEPVTYSLSNEGNGLLHQVRIPKTLLLMTIAGLSGETNVSPMMQNERATMGALYMIANAELTNKKDKGAYVTFEELISQKHVPREMLEGHGYKFFVTLAGDGFEVVGVPIEYGTSGKTSFFIDNSMVLRGADHGGSPATVADKPIQ